MRVRPPERELRHAMYDSRRWDRFTARPDDIFIATPAKCGTTWMQGIVCSLLWPDGDAPGIPGVLSPWIDQRIRPIDEVLGQLDAMEHRRFIKTHTPADAIPVFEDCSYVVVYRAPADAFVSWTNHRRGLRDEVWELVNGTAADEGIPATSLWDKQDPETLFDEWASNRLNPPDHLASWWQRRGQDGVLFVHYDDLLADLEGEMRRVAEHLDIDVPERCWPEVVDRCRIDRMRSAYASTGLLDLAFEGGADLFFHKGQAGRGRTELSAELQERCAALVRSHLDDEVADWLERGSLAAGWRP